MDAYGRKSWGETVLDNLKPALPTFHLMARRVKSAAEFRILASGLPTVGPMINDALSHVMYTAAIREEPPAIWCLTPEAFHALTETTAPVELLPLLPELPHKVMFLSLPPGSSITLPSSEGGSIDIETILLVEQNVGGMWRYVGFEGKSAAYTFIAHGHLDITAGPLARQLEDVYAPQGHNRVWNLILNLTTALRNPGYLGRRQVQPSIPRGGGKRAKFLRKKRTSSYTVVDLTPTLGRTDGGRTSACEPKGVSRHLVRGHWRRVLVNEPREDDIVESTVIAEGKTKYQVLIWIFPHYRGFGPIKSQTFKVVASAWRQ